MFYGMKSYVAYVGWPTYQQGFIEVGILYLAYAKYNPYTIILIFACSESIIFISYNNNGVCFFIILESFTQMTKFPSN